MAIEERKGALLFIMVRRPGETSWTEIWTLEEMNKYLKAGNDFEIPVHFSRDTKIQEVSRYTVTNERVQS